MTSPCGSGVLPISPRRWKWRHPAGAFTSDIQRNLRHCSGQFCTHYPFLELGLYAEQLRRYLERFGQNVWVGFHEEFKNKPIEVFQNICRFLEVDPEFSPGMAHRHLEAQVPRMAAIGWFKRSGLWAAAASVTPARLRPIISRRLIRRPGATRINPADRRYLVDFYREDIRNLESLLGRQLDAWRAASPSTPSAAPA